MGFFMGGFTKSNFAKLTGSEDSTQDAWMCSRRHCDVLPNVIYADLTLSFGYLDSKAATAAQELGISFLKEVQLSVSDLLTLGLVKHGKHPQ